VAGYVLREAEGRSYRWWDYLFTVKAGAQETEPGVAIMEFSTERGREPEIHVHDGEDEVFYVLEGESSFNCGDERFDAGPKDFVFLPRNVPHGYTIRSDGLVQLLVITISSEGGRAFGQDIEATGEPVDREDVLRYIDEVRAKGSSSA
jgi:mannose-6-phosphate isomerase-like protein (cupin superfamily)